MRAPGQMLGPRRWLPVEALKALLFSVAGTGAMALVMYIEERRARRRPGLPE